MKKSLAMAVLAATLSVGSAKAEPFVIFVYETAADFAAQAPAVKRGGRADVRPTLSTPGM